MLYLILKFMYILLWATLFALLLVETLVISILEDGNILLPSLKYILDISLIIFGN